MIEVILGVSLVLNIGFGIFLLMRKKNVKKQETYDARMLLHDLTAGAGLVRIERVAPSEVFIRSTRG